METTETTEFARILLVDDNPEIREILRVLLSAEGFSVEEAGNGQAALAKVRAAPFDLIILDVMMPGADGYTVCEGIRTESNAPILFLSAKSQEGDKLRGFSSGGDDYLSKPFSSAELIGRVKALLRRYRVYRGKKNEGAVLRAGPLTLDDRSHTVQVRGQPVSLTDTEYALLRLLLQNRGKPLSSPALFEAVWQEPYYAGANNTVMVHMRNLRKKIEEDPKHPVLLKTVWGKGYCCDEMG